ncbi:hypothetical protein [Mesobacillus subterraneus]|uniref:Uncharacterized protein n=1 Tax=Mesobacillus subterraneus TaxID=285983 RepID=A0A3R9FIE8_9BACI|nr:hypothetical protein [Mesobacillus subterraneus]RSD28780.1 hypothetical protein EJA10_04210 [Mesobacillus subterraneus]
MYWAPYLALVINLLIIWFMPKRLTKKEIYVTWFVIALVNLSTDVLFDLYLKLYELGEPGVQLSVHIIELTLGASFGIIFLNFMPKQLRPFLIYSAFWMVIIILFELMMVSVKFLNYTGWHLGYSVVFYIGALLFVRWHLFFLRKGS